MFERSKAEVRPSLSLSVKTLTAARRESTCKCTPTTSSSTSALAETRRRTLRSGSSPNRRQRCVLAKNALFVAHLEFSRQVYEHMLSRNVQPLEMTYTALIRVTASSGEPARAYQLVRLREWGGTVLCLTLHEQTKDMRAKGVAPRLRTFSPALAGFCKALELESVSPAVPANTPPPLNRHLLLITQALAVEADIRATGIALSEVEYIALLQGFAQSPRCERTLASRSRPLSSHHQRELCARVAAPHERGHPARQS